MTPEQHERPGRMIHKPGNNAPKTCSATGALVVRDVRVGWVRCELEAGHDAAEYSQDTSGVQLSPTPHRMVFEWQEDQAIIDDWPERNDPAETFDVDVPIELPACGNDEAELLGHLFPDDTCTLLVGHEPPHRHAGMFWLGRDGLAILEARRPDAQQA